MKRSFVKAIGAPTVIDGVCSATRQLVRRSSVVTLEQTVAAMRLLFEQAKIVTEWASATALAAAISRLEQTFDWVLWLGESERRLIWWRAARRPWKQITYELGVDRSTAWRQQKLALTKIAARLNVR